MKEQFMVYIFFLFFIFILNNKMKKLMKYHVQSVLVPVGNYKTIEQAAAHVKEIGYNPEYKEPHVTDNYLRFR